MQTLLNSFRESIEHINSNSSNEQHRTWGVGYLGSRAVILYYLKYQYLTKTVTRTKKQNSMASTQEKLWLRKTIPVEVQALDILGKKPLSELL